MTRQPLLQVLNVHKTFHPSGVRALRGVNLSLNAGTVHALLGANGAGKTTLVRILAGELQPDGGQILVDGIPVTFRNPRDARSYGIALVHQNLALADELTVLENVFLGREPLSLFFVSKRKARQKIKDVFERLSLKVTDERVENLSMAEKQKIEIARALLFGARVLLLDEPTAYLNEEEEEKLFELLRSLKNSGCAVLFITHDVDKALNFSDRVTVMREGQTVLSEESCRLTVQQVVEMMGFQGRKRTFQVPTVGGETLLEVSNLTLNLGKKIVLDRISFTLRRGEVIGLFGLGNDGQYDLLETIVGLKKPSSGRIVFKNQEITHLSIYERRRLGIAYVPEDRAKEALNLNGSVLENAVVNVYRKAPYARLGFLRWSLLEQHTFDMLKEFEVKLVSVRQPVRTLSGGNLQRLVLARELFQKPELLLACKPTSGLDIQIQNYVAEKLDLMRSYGCALIASNDAEEMLNLCDRVFIFSKGRLRRVLDREKLFRPEELISLAGDKG